MADTDLAVQDPEQEQPDVNQAAQPVPAQAEPAAKEDLADLVPVDDTEKPLAGEHPAEATSDLVPVAGTEKKLSLPKEQAKVQPSGVIGPTSIGPRESGFHTWLQDVQADVKNGSDSTWFGAMLKKMGAKGTNYGTPEAVGDFMSGPVLGVPKALEGVSEVGTEIGKGVTSSEMDYGKTVRGVNKAIAGTFQSLGPAALLTPEALPIVVPAMVAQAQAQKAAKYMGADDDTAELVGNVTALYSAGKIHESLHPVVERFGVAVNNRTAAEQEYVNRSRNLETARGQAAEMQQRAVDAANREAQNAQGGSEIGSAAQTDQARQLANEAAKNVADAQKAFDQASQRRADATIQLEKLGRKITASADKTTAAEYEARASEQKKASDLFQKAVPSKGVNRYTPEDEEVFRAHAEAAKAKGEKITDLPSAYEVAENARQGIEDKLDPYIEKYKDEPLTAKPEDSPKIKVAEKLAEMAKVDGNFENAMDALNEFNITDPTVGEAKGMLTKLNNYQRAAMKGANNWDIYNMIETNPDFAARFFMAEELRDALHNNLEGHGVGGSRAARVESKSLVNVRDAIGAQIRANRGGTAVRGSGTQSKLRLLVGKLTGKAIKGAGIAAGAEMGGPVGAVAGGAVGEMVGQPIEDFLAPRDITRDQHIERSFRYKGTNRKPVEIKGEGTPANIPVEKTPPAPKDAGPSAVELTPRENTELHAELAAHYGESNLEDSTYQELEQQLRQDIAAKSRNGVALDPAEKSLLTKILKADSVDRATTQAAGKPTGTAKMDSEKEADILDEAKVRAEEGEPTKLNPHLVSLGRGDESALVSHSPAMKAHVSVADIAGLGEGMTPEKVMSHEFAHLAFDAVEGEPTGVEIRSDKHPLSQKGTGATSVFDGAAVKDAAGNVDPEALQTQIVKWLTQKMAGPASHEVFDGMTKDEALSHPATRNDLRQARGFVRDIHPDFTPGQIEEVVDTAYERARDFISQPHIADRIRANAAVREEGLHSNLHVSRGRVSQFQRDILEAHNEYEGTDGTEPSGGGTGEGSKKAEKPAAEEGKKNAGGSKERSGEESRKPVGKSETARGVAESDVSKAAEERLPKVENLRVPPERTTGEYDAAIKEGGAVPAGIQKGDAEIDVPDLALFHDPATGSTLALPTDKISAENVKAQLRKSRDMYIAAEDRKAAAANLEESNVSKTAYHPDLQKVVDQNRLRDSLPFGASFITPDGRFVELGKGETHPEAIESATGREEGSDLSHQISNEELPRKDNRIKFLNDTGAIRTRLRGTQAGQELVASVPKQGVTPEQVKALQKSIGHVRNGSLVIERSDVTPETKNELSRQKDFPSYDDAETMLREINAHPESKVADLEQSNVAKDAAQGADDYNKERGLPAIDATMKPHNPEFAKRIADAYDAMKHNPDDPAVKKAYGAMANEVQKQWDYATGKLGMKFEPWTKEGQPYANSKEMMKDVEDNKHLYFFQGGDLKAESPMAQVNPKTGLSYNDMFRAVHDLFGHAATGFEFGPKGEENAYLTHRQMFPAEAVPALTTETRGQNSWVNFGKHLRDAEGSVPKKGEAGYVPPTERPYAEQKVGLLPSELQAKGPLDIDLEKHPAGGIDPRTGSMESKRYGLEIHPEDREVLDHKPTAQDFQRYADEHQDVLKQHPDLKVGWDTLGDKPELNIGVSTDNLEAAKKIGAKLDQRAIWDTKEEKEIPTGGKNTQREFPDYPLASRLADLEQSNVVKSPKGSTVPLMENPLEVEGTGKEGRVSTVDVAKALNEFSQKKNPALESGGEPKEMVDRAKKIAEDEAKYQLAQGRTGKEWYTTEMKDHDKVLQSLRPELASGEGTDVLPDHPAKLTLFKAAEAVLSSGQKPYANVKTALKAWDAYNETGEFPRVNPATGKSWGPRGVNAYGNAIDMLNQLVKEKGEKGAADWLLEEHPVKELREYNKDTKGKMTDEVPGALILGGKRGPFMQNLHGIESAFTADMWVSRSWNRWMGTMEFGTDPHTGDLEITTDSPRNNTERGLMKESFEKTAGKLGLSTSSLQAVLWYYEQALYRAHGVPKESWSFSDAASRVAKEASAPPEAEQTGFDFGENKGKDEAPNVKAKEGRVSAFDFLGAMKKK